MDRSFSRVAAMVAPKANRIPPKRLAMSTPGANSLVIPMASIFAERVGAAPAR